MIILQGVAGDSDQLDFGTMLTILKRYQGTCQEELNTSVTLCMYLVIVWTIKILEFFWKTIDKIELFYQLTIIIVLVEFIQKLDHN